MCSTARWHYVERVAGRRIFQRQGIKNAHFIDHSWFHYQRHAATATWERTRQSARRRRQRPWSPAAWPRRQRARHTLVCFAAFHTARKWSPLSVTYRWARISYFDRWARISVYDSLALLSDKGEKVKKTPPLSDSLAPLWFSLRRRFVPDHGDHREARGLWSSLQDLLHPLVGFSSLLLGEPPYRRDPGRRPHPPWPARRLLVRPPGETPF
jgi:hypothetical protein